jgi:hypothetical protein
MKGGNICFDEGSRKNRKIVRIGSGKFSRHVDRITPYDYGLKWTLTRIMEPEKSTFPCKADWNIDFLTLKSAHREFSVLNMEIPTSNKK